MGIPELTIDEKLRLLNGVGDWHTYDANGKVKSIMMTDGPHGIRKIENEQAGDITGSKPATCFPTASAIASSWNPDVSARMARSIAAEAKEENISIVLGCGVNIKRNPLCGRNFEYFSEDPFLTAKLSTSYITAMQDCGVGTSLKHFAANSQETRRMTSNSEVDERALREIYLYAFEQVVKKAKPTTIMASYNKLNGEYACANKHLLTDILRDEWGYEGIVVSDWGACINAEKCFASGLNLEMPDNRGYHFEILKRAYEEGRLSLEQINDLSKKILSMVYSFNGDKTSQCDGCHIDFDRHNLIAKEIENECAVLLTNDNHLLPISTKEKLIVIGELAENMRFQGGGSSHINPARYQNALMALKEAGYDITYLKGYENDTDRPNPKLEKEAMQGLDDWIIENNGILNGKILFFMGLTDIYEGEGYDRTTLNIPDNQKKLLQLVSKKVGKENIAAITFGGAPMDYSWREQVSAILHMHLGGQAVGESVADLVSGKVNPSGRLAETIPLDLNDVPSMKYFAPSHDDVEYRESLFVGYRFYETYNVPVQFPFGWGLSYTKFNYVNLELSTNHITFRKNIETEPEPTPLEVSITVQNTGDVAGAEVVQLYVLPPGADIHVKNGIPGDFLRSRIELKGFTKVYLEPGEQKTIKITLDASAFSVYDVEKGRFVPITGEYTVAAGLSVKDILLSKTISVEGEEYSKNERNLFPEYFNDQKAGMTISQETFARLYNKPLSEYKSQRRGDYTIESSYGDVSRASLFGWIIRVIVGIGLRFMFPGKKKTSPEMRMVMSGIEEGALEGLIANSGGIVSIKLVDLLVLNGNKQFGKALARMVQK